jgi:hypothetical protein
MISKERIRDVAYALLLIMLSDEEIRLNPGKLKRQIGNLPQLLQHLPKEFRYFSPEELQEAAKAICHDLVDYAFGFTLGKRDKKDKKKK